MSALVLPQKVSNQVETHRHASPILESPEPLAYRWHFGKAQTQQQMFEAIKDAALHLRRGDNLTIIPITDDAEADLQGQILHYEVAPIEQREAYDGDLRKMSAKISNDMSRLSAESEAHPGHTRTS